MPPASHALRTFFLALSIVGSLFLPQRPLLGASGQILRGPGLYVVDDGMHPDGFKEAYEFVSFTVFQQTTFKASLTNGTEHSGPFSQIVLQLTYNERDTAMLIDKMEKAIKLSEAAAAILKPRLQQLKEVATRPMTAAILPPQDTPKGMVLSVDGKTYSNIKPSSLSNGVLRFLHSDGGLSIVARDAPLKGLRLCERLNGSLSTNADFKQLVATFLPVLVVGDATYHGVKLESESETELHLRSDEGNVSVHRAQFFKADLDQLAAASEREAQWLKTNAMKSLPTTNVGPKILGGALVDALFDALEAAAPRR